MFDVTSDLDTVILRLRDRQVLESRSYRNSVRAASSESSSDNDNAGNGGSELQRFIEAADWEAALVRMQTHPDDLVILDRRGRCPYMTAASRANDTATSLQFLSALQQQMRTKSFVARDKTGLTALVMALKSGASRQFLKVLLQHNGRAQILTRNHQGNLPIHLLLERGYLCSYFEWLDNDQDNDGVDRRVELIDLMLRIGGTQEQLLFENNNFATPLHVCLRSGMPEDIVKLIAKGEFSFCCSCLITSCGTL